MKKCYSLIGPLAIVIVFLITSIFILEDYGITYDSPKNFEEGRINLQYLLGIQSPSAVDQIKLAMQIHGAFFFMIAQIGRSVLSDGLHILDPIAASYVFIPILTAIFLFITMKFISNQRGLIVGTLWGVMLLTVPRFFGHIFNNPKDVPLLIFYSLTLLLFYGAMFNDKDKALSWVLFFVFWSIAVLSKTYAVFVPVILLIWMILIYQFGDKKVVEKVNPPEDVMKWTFVGVFLAIVAIVALFMPAFFSISDKVGFVDFKRDFASSLVGRDVQRWTVYPAFQLLITTPVWMHFFGLVGIIQAIRKFNSDPFASLMIIWLAITLFIPATPFIYVYDGIRHFLMVLVPYTFFAAWGVQIVASWIEPKRYQIVCFLASVGIVIGLNISHLYKMHPYQTTFFNSFVGGLKGAQLSGIPYAYDYWLNSYREATTWLNANAGQNANVLVINSDSKALFDYYPIRHDLKYDKIRSVNFPKNSYVVVPRRDSWPNLAESTWSMIRYKLNTLPKVYESYRQGGEIFTIYYQQ